MTFLCTDKAISQKELNTMVNVNITFFLSGLKEYMN